MSRRTSISHRFVEFVPKELEERVLYISIPYETAVHKCACGCGNKVVTPLNPARWRILYDGKAVSLWPSIGNWSFACESHYWIKRNRIEWAPKWSRKKIEEARARDRAAREQHYRLQPQPQPVSGQAEGQTRLARLRERLRKLLRRGA